MRARILVLVCVLVVGMTGIPTAVAQPEDPGDATSGDDGFPTILVVGVVLIGIVGILVYRRRQELESEYLS